MKLKATTAMEILAVVPVDDEATVMDVVPQVSVTEHTVRTYLDQMVKDGWLERRRLAVNLYRRLWHLDKFYTPRALPEAVFIEDTAVLGPFCSNCGWNIDGHGGHLHRCPVKINALLAVPA